jgi:hypothetical protein
MSVLAPVLDRIPAQAITGPFSAALLPSATAFAMALRDPRRAQEHALERLRSVVPALARVRGLEDLRALPVERYEDVEERVARAADGDPSSLSRSPLVRFERSGGSSGAQKLVPMTRASLAEMNRALQPWLFGLYARTPGVAAGPAYWSISPMGDKRAFTKSGVPIGADDDAEYFPAPVRRVLSRVLAAPSVLSRFTTVERCRYATLRVLLEREDLALLSVWSPTFLTLLLDALDANLPKLLDDLATGLCSVDGDLDVAEALPLRAMPARAAHLRDAASRGRLTSRELWPRLALLSMWTDAAAAAFVDEARARFPGVPVQGKGLLATEGVVSVPWPNAPAPVLAVRSHVLELVDDDGRPRFVHEVEEGRTYEVLLTTGAGLVRYRLGDRVTVVGRVDATPCVRFVGRADATSDLVGEKLAAAFVSRVLDDSRPRGARFAMLAPTRHGGLHYRLYVEAAVGDDALLGWARDVDARLAEGHPYRYARALGQLGPVDVMCVVDGAARYERGCVRRGQRAGDIKPTPLHLRSDWDEIFDGRVLSSS